MPIILPKSENISCYYGMEGFGINQISINR
jgi:hypothetical protein